MMEDKMFNDLLASINEAKEILAHTKKPSRSFMIDEPDAKSIRARLKMTQNELKNMILNGEDISNVDYS